eukprot:7220559-Pyramimonas_sp.AAC.1
MPSARGIARDRAGRAPGGLRGALSSLAVAGAWSSPPPSPVRRPLAFAQARAKREEATPPHATRRMLP